MNGRTTARTTRWSCTTTRPTARNQAASPTPKRFDIARSPSLHVGFGGPATLLPRRPPGPSRAESDAARVAPRARHQRGEPAVPAVQLHQRNRTCPATLLVRPLIRSAMAADIVIGVESASVRPAPPRSRPRRACPPPRRARAGRRDPWPRVSRCCTIAPALSMTFVRSYTSDPIDVGPAGLLGQLPPRPLRVIFRRSARRPAWTSACSFEPSS